MRVIESPSMPPIGPYSVGIAVPPGGELVFFSGVIADPSKSDTFREEVESVFDWLMILLSEAGLKRDDIVDVQAFIVDLPKNGAAFNEVYGKRMLKPYPARATIGVAALPKGVWVELKVTAIQRLAVAGNSPHAAGGVHCKQHEGCG